jgi:predicted TIM-barrel fold metal-dependent hydrolase
MSRSIGTVYTAGWRLSGPGAGLLNLEPDVILATHNTSAVIIQSYLEKAIRELPAEKILFGSDGTVVDCRMEIYKIRVQKLPKEKEDLILGGNILRLLGGRL